MTTDTNDTLAQEALREVNENGNTPAQQKAADLAAEKATKKARTPKEPKEAPAPKLTVKEVVLAGLALHEAGFRTDPDDAAVLTSVEDGNEINAKAIIDRLAVLVPGNNCTSIAWYKNALKPAKGTTEAKISFLDTDGTVTVATKVWAEGFVPPKAPRKNSVARKAKAAEHDDKAYADAMDEWARQQGINVDAEGGYTLTPEQLAAFEGQYTA